jgi:hypothetical protein
MRTAARSLLGRQVGVVTGDIVLRNQGLICGVLGAGAAILLGVAGAGLAQTPTLDLKPGLWQITSTGSMTGAPPIPPEVLANMPPEKRAQVQAAMQAAMARASDPQVAKNCVTEEQLRRGLNFGERPNPSCQRKIVTNSSNLLVVHEECAGARPMVGDFRFTAIDRETMKGDINVVMGTGADMTTMQRNLQGKWIGSDCGDVKPKD